MAGETYLRKAMGAGWGVVEVRGSGGCLPACSFCLGGLWRPNSGRDWGECGAQVPHGIPGHGIPLGEGVLGWGEMWELFAVQIARKEQMSVEAQGGPEGPCGGVECVPGQASLGVVPEAGASKCQVGGPALCPASLPYPRGPRVHQLTLI